MLDFRTTKGLRFVNDGARATYVFANHFPISEDYQAKWRRRIRKLLLNADTLERYVRLRRDPFQTDRLVTVGDEDRTSFHKLVSLRGTRIARAIIRALQSSEVSFGDASKNNQRNM